MYFINLFYFNIYNFNNNLINLGRNSHYIINVFKNFWKIYLIKNNNIIINVNLHSNKFYIKKSIEFILNICVIKINTLISKRLKKKKAFISFLVKNDN